MTDAIEQYETFLRAKIGLASSTGFRVGDADINPILMPHQRDIVRWAVEGGKRAIFASFGLGKTVMQIEVVRLILQNCGGKGLIICPLGVKSEFIKDGKMLDTHIQFVKRDADIHGDGIYLTNYESVRDGKIDALQFTVVSLDEASVLRSYGSKTYQEFLSIFKGVEFRFVATATPSPNKFKELIHYAAFLGIMDSGAALTRFFQRDSTKANNLTLHPHHTEAFWMWMHSWAVFLQRPSQLGYSDAGYDLPPLDVKIHEVPTLRVNGDTERNGQMTINADSSLGLAKGAKEKRDSLDTRIAKMIDIVQSFGCVHGKPNQIIVWVSLNDEQDAAERALKDLGLKVASVYGSLDDDEKEIRIESWKSGESDVLLAKLIMLGSGGNLQQSHRMIFLGVDYKANDFMQGIHRIQRFQQAHPCEAHIIHTEAERQVLRTMMTKWENHKTMGSITAQLIAEHGLNSLSTREVLARSIGVERLEVSGHRFKVANNDAVLEARRIEGNSVGEIITSIPFGNHYEYSASYNDFGHTENNDHFWAQMDFLTPELLRILQPGRECCIHVKDRILFGSVTGEGCPTVSPFHCEAIMHYLKHGFQYMGMITVVTDVVRENNQTYRLGWSENAKDGSKMGVGSPEYVLIFRKPQTDKSKAYADVRVEKSKDEYTRARWQVDAHANWRSSGDRHLTADEMAAYGPAKLASIFTKYTTKHIYDYEWHVKIGESLDAKGALPSTFMSILPGSHCDDVWTDVNRMLTLNTTQAQKGREMHICPLQLDIIDRLIDRYSNPGDMVYDPFNGLGSVVVQSIKKGRRGGGSELNAQYFLDSLNYIRSAEDDFIMPSLFEFEELRDEVAA